jgi:hypothetical protein
MKPKHKFRLITTLIITLASVLGAGIASAQQKGSGDPTDRELSAHLEPVVGSGRNQTGPRGCVYGSYHRGVVSSAGLMRRSLRSITRWAGSCQKVGSMSLDAAMESLTQGAGGK